MMFIVRQPFPREACYSRLFTVFIENRNRSTLEDLAFLLCNNDNAMLRVVQLSNLGESSHFLFHSSTNLTHRAAGKFDEDLNVPRHEDAVRVKSFALNLPIHARFQEYGLEHRFRELVSESHTRNFFDLVPEVSHKCVVDEGVRGEYLPSHVRPITGSEHSEVSVGVMTRQLVVSARLGIRAPVGSPKAERIRALKPPV